MDYKEKIAAVKEPKCEQIGRLIKIMEILRAECPWDSKQTFTSLINNTIEETYELCEALRDNDPQQIKGELGDLLLHIVFYSKIAQERNLFDIEDVAEAICNKLIFRHPHVFGETSVSGAGEVVQKWEELKKIERQNSDKQGVLSGVPTALPAMIKSHRIQGKAAAVGFDWDNKEDVWNKVKEEISEFEVEINACEKKKAEEEFGDILFALINVARHYKIDPEAALENCNRKFIKRFNYIEEHAAKQNKELSGMSLDEMEDLWQQAKKNK